MYSQTNPPTQIRKQQYSRNLPRFGSQLTKDKYNELEILRNEKKILKIILKSRQLAHLSNAEIEQQIEDFSERQSFLAKQIVLQKQTEIQKQLKRQTQYCLRLSQQELERKERIKCLQSYEEFQNTIMPRGCEVLLSFEQKTKVIQRQTRGTLQSPYRQLNRALRQLSQFQKSGELASIIQVEKNNIKDIIELIDSKQSIYKEIFQQRRQFERSIRTAQHEYLGGYTAQEIKQKLQNLAKYWTLFPQKINLQEDIQLFQFWKNKKHEFGLNIQELRQKLRQIQEELSNRLMQSPKLTEMSLKQILEMDQSRRTYQQIFRIKQTKLKVLISLAEQAEEHKMDCLQSKPRLSQLEQSTRQLKSIDTQMTIKAQEARKAKHAAQLVRLTRSIS